jgi:hypothetical protein
LAQTTSKTYHWHLISSFSTVQEKP